MNGLNNDTYKILLVLANLIAIFQLIAAIKWPRVARISFFIYFSWACWMNWKTALQSPEDYLEYANLTWSGWYRDFINGWFAEHIRISVGLIAVCQGLIAISMLLKGWIFKLGAAGAILFLVAIIPLGIGSGFPATVIMAVALFILIRRKQDLIWRKIK